MEFGKTGAKNYLADQYSVHVTRENRPATQQDPGRKIKLLLCRGEHQRLRITGAYGAIEFAQVRIFVLVEGDSGHGKSAAYVHGVSAGAMLHFVE